MAKSLEWSGVQLPGNILQNGTKTKLRLHAIKFYYHLTESDHNTLHKKDLTHWKESTKKTEQTGMLIGPKQKIHCGRIPEHCDQSEAQDITDYVQTQ